MILIATGVERTASTWLEAIFLAIRLEFDLCWHPRGPDSYRSALAAGGLEDDHIYVGVFLKWDELELERCRYPYRVLHVRRDPRDILVSRYFSLRDSHGPDPAVEFYRPLLKRLSFEEGLFRLFDDLEEKVEILLSYVGRSAADRCQVHDFAEITANPMGPIRELLRSSGLRLSDRRLRELLDERAFSVLSGGRDPGDERTDHHFRRGISGEWREKLPPRVIEAMGERFGEALMRLGYEKDRSWVAANLTAGR